MGFISPIHIKQIQNIFVSCYNYNTTFWTNLKLQLELFFFANNVFDRADSFINITNVRAFSFQHLRDKLLLQIKKTIVLFWRFSNIFQEATTFKVYREFVVDELGDSCLANTIYAMNFNYIKCFTLVKCLPLKTLDMDIWGGSSIS